MSFSENSHEALDLQVGGSTKKHKIKNKETENGNKKKQNRKTPK